MKKSNKWLLIILGVLLVVFVILLVLYLVFKDDNKEKLQVDVLEEIPEYGYELTSLDSEYYASIFKELNDILSKEEINKEEYAKTVAKLFITDLYTISTKINKYDVGGDIYYHSSPDKNSEFKLKVVEQFYNYLEDNTYGDRKQELPTVKNVEVVDYQLGEYTLYKGTSKEQVVSSYVIQLKWDFEKDLGYDTKGEVILVDNEKKIEVVEYNPET